MAFLSKVRSLSLRVFWRPLGGESTSAAREIRPLTRLRVFALVKDPGTTTWHQEVLRRIRECTDKRLRAHARTCEVHLRYEARTDSDTTTPSIFALIGYSADEAEDRARFADIPHSELVFIERPRPELTPRKSASLLRAKPQIVHPDDLEIALDKAILRLKMRHAGLTCQEIPESGLEEYFRLRYRVYKPLGYIRKDYDATTAQMELNYSDRWALPLGIYSGDALIACARLVSGFGELNDYMQYIDRVVQTQQDSTLRIAAQVPLTQEFTYDVLEEFPGLVGYYRQLVRGKVQKVELSRVIVDPACQGCGLGEVLVDTSLALAKSKHLSLMFLACLEKHKQFYERSGFKAIQGLESPNFGVIPGPAIVMEKNLAKR